MYLKNFLQQSNRLPGGNSYIYTQRFRSVILEFLRETDWKNLKEAIFTVFELMTNGGLSLNGPMVTHLKLK